MLEKDKIKKLTKKACKNTKIRQLRRRGIQTARRKRMPAHIIFISLKSSVHYPIGSEVEGILFTVSNTASFSCFSQIVSIMSSLLILRRKINIVIIKNYKAPLFKHIQHNGAPSWTPCQQKARISVKSEVIHRYEWIRTNFLNMICIETTAYSVFSILYAGNQIIRYFTEFPDF